MNKASIEEKLKELNIMEGEYYVVGSSAMVIRGIREVAGDLDLCMTEKALNELKTRYNVQKTDKGYDNLYKINDEIEFFVDPKEKFNVEYAHGWPLEDIHVLLDFKLKRNAEKDQVDIINIRKYLEEQENN